MRRLLGAAVTAALIASLSCGPRKGTEEPGDEDGSFEPVMPPAVTFSNNLDIALEVPSDPGKLPSPEVLWRTGFAGALGMAGHLVIHASEREGRVTALDVRDGSTAWEAQVPPCPVCAFRLSPHFDGERVIVSSGSRLAALDVRDGSESWSLDLQGLPDGPGTLLEGRVLVVRTLERVSGPACASVTTRILFVETSSGSILWRLEFMGLLAEFAAAGGFLHVFVSESCGPGEPDASTSSTMRVYRLADREMIEEIAIDPPLSPPVVAAGRIVLETASGLVGILPGTTGTEWRTQDESCASQSLAIHEQKLILMCAGMLRVLDAQSGELLYEVDLGDVRFRQGLNVLPTVAVTGTYILVPMEPDPLRGYLVAFDLDSGKVRRLFRGFGPVLQTLAWGGTGVLLLGDEVIAVDVLGKGTAERDLIPVSAAVTKLVRDLEEDVPFVPWSAAAEEVRRLGKEAVETLVTLAEEGSLVAALIVARVLVSSPEPERVPALVGFLSMPVPGSDGSLVPVHSRLVYETIRALGAAADPRATGALLAIVEDEGQDPVIRAAGFAALGSIAAAGDEKTREAIAGYRSSRVKAAGHGWSPCPVPASLLDHDGPFAVPPPACQMSVDTPFSSSRSVATPDGSWLAYVSPALGGRNDVWIAHLDDSKLVGPWFTGLTVPGLLELQFLDLDDDGTLTLESVERECDGCYVDDSDRPESGKPDETPIDPATLSRDSDKDGWTDIVEKRLGTNPTRKDTDKDGLKDPEDPSPLASSKMSKNLTDRQEVLDAAFFALLGFGQ
ncbi:MAG: PQQ-binding-like beta-propeller repeat protein, partial [Deltaproteobacteria bacterium]|nr:PQQ-binding-like beta-propeller repeat protein [Deltaproteobacteria bacterium]